ncbi:MAG: DUF975 family protein [Clostridia bacterium]|nr:DUF975 family protein [Clostridia bacterium]
MIRSELKARGKAAFKANYWKSVLVAILLTIAVGGWNAGSSSTSVDFQDLTDPQPAQSYSIDPETLDPLANEDFDVTDIDQDFGVLLDNETAQSESAPVSQRLKESINVGSIAGLGTLSFLLTLFLFGPLEVSGRNFFKKNLGEKAELDELNRGFVPKYWNNMITMALKNLFVVLGFICFIIPGIIVSYGMELVPYILADNPGMGIMDVIRASWNMMKGHKWELFVLDLSFIGWILLEILTLGILGLFYVNPYIFSTHAAFYEEVKALNALEATPKEA